MPRGDVAWLFQQAEWRKDMPRDHWLVRREALMEFFGVSRRTWESWRGRGLIKPYYNDPRRFYIYDLSRFFDEERRLTFIPPLRMGLLEGNLDGDQDKDFLDFLRSLNPPRP